MSELFIRILNTSITAGYLVLAVLLLRLALKRAPKWSHCLLWAIVALRLLLPFSIESAFSLIPSAEPIPPSTVYTEHPAIDSGIPPIDEAINPILSETLAKAPAASADPGQILIGTASVLWVVGLSVMLLFGLFSYIRLALRVRPSIRDSEGLFLCDQIDTPFILGIVRPRIYLPSGLDSTLIPPIVRHERAHLSRGDHLWKPLGFLLLALHWFNPLLWVAYILLCRDIESACDERVIRNMDANDKKGYSEALLSCSMHRRTVMACPLAFGEVGVRERIRAVLGYKKPAFWIIILAVITAIVTAACFLTSPVKAVDRIMDEKGYTILDQYWHDITLSVPVSALPESAFSEDGLDFPKNKIIAYRDDTTTVYLSHVQYANEGEDLLYFGFDMSYHLPKEGGAFLAPYHVTGENRVFHRGVLLRSKHLRSGPTVYENAVSVRGLGPDEQIWFYVSTDVLRAAEGTVDIDISLNRISYLRGTVPASRTTSANATLYHADYIGALKRQYPEYFGLDTTAGLDVYFCMFAPESYRLCLFSGIEEIRTARTLMETRLVYPDTMRAILSTYDLSPIQLRVHYFSHVISSYAAGAQEIPEQISAVRELLGFGHTAVRQIPPKLLISAADKVYDASVHSYSITYFAEEAGIAEQVTYDTDERGIFIYHTALSVSSDVINLHFEILPDTVGVEIYDAESGELLETHAVTNRLIPLHPGTCLYRITAEWSTHDRYSGNVCYEIQFTK